jgi:beta-glucosidase
MKGLTATFSIANTGKRAGADVGQLYLVSRAGKKMQRLVGFKRVTLEPGASEKVTVTIDPRLIADWQGGRWVVPQGDYAIALGRNAEELSSPVTVRFSKKILK